MNLKKANMRNFKPLVHPFSPHTPQEQQVEKEKRHSQPRRLKSLPSPTVEFANQGVDCQKLLANHGEGALAKTASPSSGFFIPGITGRARWLMSDYHDTASRGADDSCSCNESLCAATIQSAPAATGLYPILEDISDCHQGVGFPPQRSSSLRVNSTHSSKRKHKKKKRKRKKRSSMGSVRDKQVSALYDELFSLTETPKQNDSHKRRSRKSKKSSSRRKSAPEMHEMRMQRRRSSCADESQPTEPFELVQFSEDQIQVASDLCAASALLQRARSTVDNGTPITPTPSYSTDTPRRNHKILSVSSHRELLHSPDTPAPFTPVPLPERAMTLRHLLLPQNVSFRSLSASVMRNLDDEIECLQEQLQDSKKFNSFDRI